VGGRTIRRNTARAASPARGLQSHHRRSHCLQLQLQPAAASPGAAVAPPPLARLRQHRRRQQDEPWVASAPGQLQSSARRILSRAHVRGPHALRKTPFLSNLYINAIILPRQARDKHRKS
jgi:hypothetical protein